MIGLSGKCRIALTAVLLCCATLSWGQTSNAAVSEDSQLGNTSPDGQGSSVNGSGSVDITTGSAQASIPIYTVKCGSLTLPLSLNYSYNGLQLDVDATWVGLGWSLTAGVVTRVMQGAADSTRTSGKNYGQYSIKDSLLPTVNANFINNLYLNSQDTSYDPAPDLMTASFNGYSVQFYWYKGKAYMLSYNKEVKVIWNDVTSYITIVTGDGTKYNFGADQYTLLNITQFHQTKNFNTAYYLSSIISADNKDTITLSYSASRYVPPSPPSSYVQGTVYIDNPTNVDTLVTQLSVPSLSSISCRTTQVNFVLGSVARTDLTQPNQYSVMPSLQEIDVMDAVTGTTINKNRFYYGYFTNTAGSPASFFQRLKLKQFCRINTLTGSDSLTYNFRYLNENSNDFPGKGNAVDSWGYWGLANGYFTAHDINKASYFPNCSHGALDTLYFPTGGYTTYSYELNDYDSSSTQHHALGPGIRVNKIAQYLAGSTVPATSTSYSYLADNGTSSSGSLSNLSVTAAPIYISDTVNFNKYVLNNNSPGNPTLNDVFYYTKVTQKTGTGGDIHRTDSYFKSYSNFFNDISLTKQIQYRYDSVLTTYSPAQMIVNNIDTTTDSTFLILNTFIDSSYALSVSPTIYQYKYGYAYYYTPTYWKRLNNQITRLYDPAGDSTTTTIYYYYNNARNNDSLVDVLPDGRIFTDKFKRAEDYTTSLMGKLVAAHLTDPLIEQQTWVKYGATAPKFLSGTIVVYDTTVLKTTSVYSMETTSPGTSLKNETLTGGLYNTLISDTSLYVLKTQFYYDGNNMLSQSTPASNISTSYLYNYHHSLTVATATNATASQIAYTSFESDGNGNWSVPSTKRDSTNYFTGISSYNLTNGSVSISGLNSSLTYIVSYWARGATTINSSAPTITGKTIAGWTYYESAVSATTSVTVAGSTNIDELRLHPNNAQMTTRTYLPIAGITSICSPDNHLKYYDYDGYYRVKDVKDEDKNILKLYDYGYNQPYTYYNTQKIASFTRNNCSCGYYGSSVSDTLAAGLYSSHSSQFDADQLAMTAFSSIGQTYANTHGTCTAIPCGTEANGYYIINCVCELGTKIYTSSVWTPSAHAYLCTYHWQWSNGSVSGNYTEYDASQCVLN